MLSDNGDFTILAVEPNVKELPKVLENRKNVELVTLDDAEKKADIIVVLVNHKEFSMSTLDASNKVLDFVNAVV